jgi:hypothetical protein
MLALLSPLVVWSADLQVWLVPGIGMACTAFALAMGWAFLGKRRRPHLAAPPRKGPGEPSALPRDPFIYGSAAERRIALRRGGNPTAILVTDAERKGEPIRGWVVDRSTGGMCLAITEQVQPGTILNVRAVNAPETASWIEMEVKSCRRETDSWELGCQFIKTPPWGVLLLFG